MISISIYFFVVFLTCASTEKIPVWIDCDPSVGEPGRDIDDGLAMLQSFNSPELEVRGVSIIFGNTNIQRAVEIGEDIVARFSPEAISVFTGASSRHLIGSETPASLAIRDALKVEKMIILALGAATNVATVILNNPNLHSQIREVVAVAGRRPGQKFITGSESKSKGHSDLNFESDVDAFRVIFQSSVPLVLAPFEISSKVWLQQHHIQRLRRGNIAAQWIAKYAQAWLET